MPKILISNDDGIYAPGIRALAKAMQGIAEIVVVAPDVEQSAVGHGITVRRPLRFRKTNVPGLEGVTAYRVDGTPADCVVLGVHKLGRPDLVVSGINHGPNLGNDLTHSGTFAAALEGTHLGIPSIAFSLQFSDEMDFSQGAAYAPNLALEVLKRGLPAKTVLNVNFPTGKPKGVRVTRQGTHHYEDSLLERVDPDGRAYYWIAGKPTGDTEPDSDFSALEAGFISITPLFMDFTHLGMLETVKAFAPKF
jgi:5'-nucleotidase